VRAGERQWRSLTALALLAAAGSAHADYKDDYAHGLKAFRDGQYGEARKLMQQAVEDHAEPAQKIRLYGQVYEAYLPQHYLGMAAFKLGDCSSAAAQWNSSANKQIIGQFPDLGSEEQRSSATCGPKIVKTEEKPPVVSPVIPAEPPKKTTENPPVKITENKQPETIPQPPRPPPPKPPQEKPPVVKGGPPEPLVQAFDSYLAGRYGEVARINPDSYADSRARFHAYLVRAASKFTLSRLTADEALLKSARADAAAAHALDAGAQPDATLFSPGFRTFFQESR
jgi:hypothetical protein